MQLRYRTERKYLTLDRRKSSILGKIQGFSLYIDVESLCTWSYHLKSQQIKRPSLTFLMGLCWKWADLKTTSPFSQRDKNQTYQIWQKPKDPRVKLLNINKTILTSAEQSKEEVNSHIQKTYHKLQNADASDRRGQEQMNGEQGQRFGNYSW